MHSNTHSRAGLVVLTLALFISFILAAPIPNSAQLSTHPSGIFSHWMGGGEHLMARDHAIKRDTVQVQKDDIISSSRASINSKDKRELVVDPVRRNFFDKIKSGFQKVAHSISQAAQSTASRIKQAAQKVGSGIRNVAHAVGSFVNDNKSKIGKFGLKVVSTVEKIGSKVVSYIPVVGKPLSKALDVASTATNAASNGIHANLGGTLDRGMHVMDEVEKVSGYFK